MKRLKLIKNEFFDIYVYPLVLTLISLVWFVILCIAFNYMPMEKIEQSFSAFVFAMEMIIFLCII